MITLTLLASALLLGYVVAVGLTFALTMGITPVAPAMVTRESYLTGTYKLLQDLLWLLCSAAGAYAAGLLAGGVMPWVLQASLAAILIAMMWRNDAEIRQRGLGHTILSTVLVLTGVLVGYRLAL